MIFRQRRQQNGAALIMVLMIVAIMTVVVTSTVYKNRLLLKEAELQQNYSNARIKLKTVKAELIYQIMTTPLFLMGANSELTKKYELPSQFNFHGYPFDYLESEITIQASNGLVSLEPFDEKGFTALLINLGVDLKEQSILIDSLKDWIDPDNFSRLNGAEWRFYGDRSLPRNGVIQSFDELLMVRGMTDELWQALRPHLILFGYGSLSARFTSDELLPLTHSNFDTKKIIETRKKLRESGEDPLSSLYGDEARYPGNRLFINVAITYGEQVYQESFVIAKGIGDTEPYIITDNIVGTYGN
ncbi:general secretion pathway protein GspK [Aliivibrio wodanis]|uniref:general secretion pathway protein GspK n=1 Tax=Aliivibrio wodanis TaxID=80852 RepID=UPI00406C8AFC